MSVHPRPSAGARPPQALRPRHVPQRTCIACRTVQAKRGLVRIVRTPQGRVQVDLTGRAAGRGAYLHRDVGCLAEGLRKGRLAKTLRATLSAEDQAALERSLQEIITVDEQGTARRET
ncbi:MAG: YlxR family protein [Chloroflexi bacterium]|nr:YlxR family protein [Chloroflexota bacterium]